MNMFLKLKIFPKTFLYFIFSVFLFNSLSTVVFSQRKKTERASVNVSKKKKRVKKKKKKLNATKKSADQILGIKLEKKLVDGIEKTLRFLLKTVKKLPKKSKARFEMMSKILQLYVEQSAFIAGTEREKFDVKWRKWNQKGGKGKPPKIDNRISKSKWWKVYRTAKAMQKEFPKFPGIDLIIFNAALAQQYIGNENQAAREYLTISKKYPKSSVAGDAYFSLGDFYFDKGNYKNAAQFYRKALKYRRSTRYGWALFKLGWSLYNLSQFENALSAWKKAVVYGDRQEGIRGNIIKDETLRDMVYVYAELKIVNSAIRYYQRYGGEKYIPALLKLLSSTFTEQGKFSKAALTWKRIISLYPESAEAFEAQVEIINIMYDLKKYSSLWEELKYLNINFSSRSRWAQKNEKDIVNDAQKTIQEKMIYYPKLVHLDGQNLENVKVFKAAYVGYKLYLGSYPKSRDIPEVFEYMADIEYALNRFSEAGKFYEKIVDMGPKAAVTYNSKGKISKRIHIRSSKNMLDAYSKKFEKELQGILKRKPNFKKPALALSKDASNFIRSCQKYLKFYPKDKKTKRNCDVFITEIYYRGQNRKLSEVNLWNLIRRYPGSKEGNSAVNNMIFLLSDRKDKMEDAARKILKIPAYQKGKIGDKLRDLLNSIAIERVSSEKDPLKRAGKFLNLALKRPKSPDADKFLNNAAADYIKVNKIHDALKAFQLIVSRYPKSSFYKSSLAQLGKIHHGMFALASSIPFFVKYGNSFPKEKDAPAALQQACLNSIALGASNAVKICTDFSSKFPKLSQYAMQSLLSYIWRTKQSNLYYSILTKNYLPRYKVNSSEKIILYYKVYQMEKEGSQKKKLAYNMINRFGRSAGSSLSGEALRYYGELVFQSVLPQQKRFSKIKLNGGSVESLQRSIESNFNRLIKLENSYQRVFKTQDSYWGVAAFYNIGSAYERFSNLLKNPPAVKGVPRKDLVNQLSGSVEQVRLKAKEYYSGGLQAVRKFSVFNQYSVKIYNALNRVTGRSTSMQEIIVTPDFIGSEVRKI